MKGRYIAYVLNWPSWRQLFGRLRRLQIGYGLDSLRNKLRYPVAFRYTHAAGNRMIYHNMCIHTGILHSTRNLSYLLKEASYLGRTAILFPMALKANHNAGKAVISPFAEYYDLANSRLAFPHGEEMPENDLDFDLGNSLSSVTGVPGKALDYIDVEDFLRQSSGSHARFVPLHGRIDSREAERYPLIVRSVQQRPMWWHNMDETDPFHRFFAQTRACLEIAPPLKQLAEQLVSTLGDYYVLRWRSPWDPPANPEVGGTADKKAGVIGREGHYWQDIRRDGNWATIRRFVNGRSLCRQLSKIFPPGSNLYIASNLLRPQDEEFFGPLRELYKVYRYYDFASLLPFAEGPDRNTAKLFLIERLLQDGAKGSFVFHPVRPTSLAAMRQLLQLPEAS